MTGLDEREAAFEAKYAHEEQMDFATEARACKLFGLIIAEKLGFEGAEADSYAMDVVEANLEEAGFEDVFRKVRPDLDGKDASLSDHELNVLMDQALAQAKAQIAAGE